MSFMIQQRLEYPDHREEISSLNEVLAKIQFGYPQGHPPEMESTVRFILARLDQLMTTEKAILQDYNQFEVHH
jgi:hypothetical protein